MEGTSWGTFEIIEPIGQGAMGIVYEARDTVLDRHVALKILFSRQVENAQGFASSCLHEARIAANLDHPNIVTVYQVGEHDGLGFIAMQLVRGKSAANDQPFSVEKSIGVVRAIAVALSYAHKRGLVHRDVKPENLLLGEDGSVKLADFGLAEVRKAGSCSSVTDRVDGTPAFMSPEQAQGLRLDGRSDLYSLGATWFTMLTGQMPYKGSNYLEVLVAHVEQPTPDVRMLRPDVPGPIAALISRLLSKNPEDRPASAEELLAELAAAESALSQIAGTSRRSRRARWALVAAMLVGPIGLALCLGNSATSRDNKDVLEVAQLSSDTPQNSTPQKSEPSSSDTETVIPGENRDAIAQRMTEPTTPSNSFTEMKPVEKETTPVPAGNISTTPMNESPAGGKAVQIPPSLLGIPIINSQAMPRPTSIAAGLPFGLSIPNKKPPTPPKGKGQMEHRAHPHR
jgi:serine/threonine protein kinase